MFNIKILDIEKENLSREYFNTAHYFSKRSDTNEKDIRISYEDGLDKGYHRRQKEIVETIKSCIAEINKNNPDGNPYCAIGACNAIFRILCDEEIKLEVE